jgi:hypothetical protein
MEEAAALPRRAPLQRLNLAAALFACTLSIACLAKGAVYDSVVAALLLILLPILGLALSDARQVHPRLWRIGLICLGVFGAVVTLQQFLPALSETGAWQAVAAWTGAEIHAPLAQDKAAWMQGLGRFLLLALVFALALLVGTTESSARWFFHALLISGALGLSVTFFTATRDEAMIAYRTYSHGFVNANNAAAYAGIMLLVALAQAVRFFRLPGRNFHKTVLTFIDSLSIKSITYGVFLLFALLLGLAGLMLTGSRAGIMLGVLVIIVFAHAIVMKMEVEPQVRMWLVAATVGIAVPVVIWVFINFGQVIVNKFATNGLSSNSRMDIQAAVVPMIKEYPVLGAGLGSFPAVFQQYRPASVSADGIIDKAHNSYLEFAAEMGVPAFLVLMVVLVWFGLQLYNGYRARKERYVIPLLGLMVWLYGALFSLVDFPLQIPALAALVIAILVVATSQTDPNFSEPLPPSHGTAGKRVRIRKKRRSAVVPPT